MSCAARFCAFVRLDLAHAVEDVAGQKEIADRRGCLVVGVASVELPGRWAGKLHHCLAEAVVGLLTQGILLCDREIVGILLFVVLGRGRSPPIDDDETTRGAVRARLDVYMDEV